MTQERTDFLYPFLGTGAADTTALLEDLAGSAMAKAAHGARLAERAAGELAGEVAEVAAAMAERGRAGGRVFTMGNGGSATDADTFAELVRSPADGPGLPAQSLVEDQSVLSALGNDVGFELVFSRQVIAHGRSDDVLVGFSTSGNSANLLAAFAEAHRRGLLTVGFAGYRGGAMAVSGDVDHCLVVPSDSVHRIQEAQAALALALCRRARQLLRQGRASPGGEAPW